MRFKLKCLFCINFILCGIARLAINCLPLKHISPYFGMLYQNTLLSTVLSKQQLRYAIILRRSIKLASKYTPWNSNCLTQAMVAKFWCKRLNIPYVLYIGFAKDKTKPEGYAAHAWLTAGPIAITGEYSFAKFHVISSYVPEVILTQANSITRICI
ncbi:MAG: lasso peptide biosynthesis B2 protein [Legionella sp.]|nr:lasso peptide biosynthesis B2 protein [Legionella sp.]